MEIEENVTYDQPRTEVILEMIHTPPEMFTREQITNLHDTIFPHLEYHNSSIINL